MEHNRSDELLVLGGDVYSVVIVNNIDHVIKIDININHVKENRKPNDRNPDYTDLSYLYRQLHSSRLTYTPGHPYYCITNQHIQHNVYHKTPFIDIVYIRPVALYINTKHSNRITVVFTIINPKNKTNLAPISSTKYTRTIILTKDNIRAYLKTKNISELCALNNYNICINSETEPAVYEMNNPPPVEEYLKDYIGTEFFDDLFKNMGYN